MEAFTMEIAGLVTRVQPMFVTTREYCRDYLSDHEPDFFVEVTEDDLAYEQKMLDMEAVEEGLKFRKFSNPFLERTSIQRKIAYELLKRDTVLLHGSTVGVDGYAYLFTAPCGTGKSTHTRLWREAFGSRTVIVNDDKTFIRITPSGIFAYGSPWSGKHGLQTNICLPLKGICFLSRGSENVITPAKPEECIPELRHQSLIPENPAGQTKAFALIDALAQQMHLWQLKCTKDISAALVSSNAMANPELL
jgi:hypothetical protein